MGCPLPVNKEEGGRYKPVGIRTSFTMTDTISIFLIRVYETRTSYIGHIEFNHDNKILFRCKLVNLLLPSDFWLLHVTGIIDKLRKT